MNTAIKILLGSALLASYGISQADCPQYLNAKQTYDCIVEEGAGGTYVPPKTADTVKSDTQASAASDNSSNEKLAKNNSSN